MGDVVEMSARLTKVEKSIEFDSSGGGGDNGDMELTEKVIRLEEKVSGMDKRLELVEKDIRTLASKVDSHFMTLAGMIIALGVGMAGMMAKGFHWF